MCFYAAFSLVVLIRLNIFLKLDILNQGFDTGINNGWLADKD